MRKPIPTHSLSIEAENRATVASAFVAGLLSGWRSRGADPARLLAGAGLGPEHLDGRVRTPIAAYAALYNAVVREMGDEAFGLFAQRLRPGAFEFLCRGVVGAPTLGEALARAGRFLDVVLPDLELRVVVDGAAARLEIGERRRLRPRASDPRRVFAFEWLLRLLHGLACWLVGRGLTLDAVAFPYPRPAHAAEYSRVYTERSSFDAPKLAATLAVELLDLPVRRSEDDLAAFLEGSPGKIAMLYRRDREAARAVREALGASLASAPGFDAVAAALHLSARSLHRRLAEEGTSYRQIRDALRRDEALHRLEDARARVCDVAAALGYSEPSAFFRAFVNWTGMSPSEYRMRRSTDR